jgi:hypothetical protein
VPGKPVLTHRASPSRRHSYHDIRGMCPGVLRLPAAAWLHAVTGCAPMNSKQNPLQGSGPFGSPSVPAGSSGPHSANPAAGRRLSSAEPAARFRAAR